MSWGEKQQKEIETIRERKITVKLSDADCDRLARKCGVHGLTIGELIANFVGDLVGGTYSNGSDERDYADQWFERCWFGMFPEPTLLNHLLNLGYEPEHYLDMLENVETIKSDIEITKQNIAEPSDEWKDIVYHKYNDDRTSYECVPCYNSVDEYRGLCGHHEPCRIPHKPCSIGVLCRAYKGGNPYQSSFIADTGTYRLCADKVVCKRVYEVKRVLLN